MPLTLFIVSIILLLVTTVGGIVACRGIIRAQDGYEDEEGFHLRTAAAAGSAEQVLRSEEADAAGARV